MSLINDALKKAQKQRTGEAPSLGSLPSVGGESPHRIAKRSKPAGFDTLVMRAGIGGAVMLVLAVAGWFILRKPETGNLKPEGSQAQTTTPSSPQPAVSSTPSPSPIASSPAPAQPAFTLPVATSSSGGPVPASHSLGDGRSAPAAAANVGGTSRPDAPAASSAPTQQPTTNNQQPAPISAPAPKLEPRAIEFIENIKVAGIRASATDAKVLMNDRVYRVGSMVSAEFGLKLVDITANSLTFEDDKGGRYTRTF